MNALHLLADTATHGGTTLSGLLAQINGTAGNAAQGGLFSALLAQNKGGQSGLSGQGQFLAAEASSANGAAKQNAAASRAASDRGGSVAQNLKDIASCVHKMINLARQANAAPATSNAAVRPCLKSSTADATPNNSAKYAAQKSSDTTPSSAPDNNTVSDVADQAVVATAATEATTPPPSNNGDSDPTASVTSTTTDNTAPQSLSDLAAQLLALMQMLVGKLQPTPITTGGDAPQPTDDQIVASTDAAGDVSALSDAAKPSDRMTMTELSLALATAPAAAIPVPDTAASANQNTAVLDNAPLVQKVAETLKQTQETVAQLFGDSDEQTTSTDVAAATIADTAPSQGKSADNHLSEAQLAKLSSLENSIKDMLAHLQQAAVSAPVVAVAAPAVASPGEDKTKASDTTEVTPLLSAAPPAPSAPISTAPTDFSVAAASPLATANENAGNNDAGNDDFLSGGNRFASTAAVADAPNVNAGQSAPAASPYSFASNLSAAKTSANPSPITQAAVVDQVVLHLNRGVKNGNDEISLQLHPADLGKITIKLGFDNDGKVKGTVTADNPQTLDLLQKDSKSLEHALQDAGLRTDAGSLQFNLGGQEGQKQQAGQGANGNNRATKFDDGTIAALDGAGLSGIAGATETYYLTPSGVNICV